MQVQDVYKRQVTQYVSKNSAPREVYQVKLKGNYTQKYIGSVSYTHLLMKVMKKLGVQCMMLNA